METVEGVENVHHVHIWQLDERQSALEAHVVVKTETLHEIESLKQQVKKLLHSQFSIHHSTLEIEVAGSSLCDEH